MGIKKTEVVLEPAPGGGTAFLPGQMLKGNLLVTISGNRSHEVKKFMVKIRGLAKTEWESNSVYGDIWVTKERTETQHFIYEDITLLEATLLQPGEYRYPFSYQLPDHLPPTMKKIGKGKIKYKVKGRAMSQKFFKFDGEADCKFEVLRRLDLNETPSLANPIKESGNADKPLFGESPGEYRVNLERKGYVAGQTINVHIDGSMQLMDNLAKENGVVKLKQWWWCRAGKKTREGQKTLLEVTPTNWRHVQLVVPDDLMSIEDTLCAIINVVHYVKIKSVSLDLRIPIVIGTIPLNPK